MAMNLGGGGKKKGVSPEMNVTPLVDVVLVLLIIFMVITPLLSKHFWIHTPKQEKEEIEQPEQKDPDPPLVLRIAPDKTINVNGVNVERNELSDRLRRMFAAREDHILFFDAADEVPYGFAVEVMDQAREGGAVTIATLTTALQATGDGPEGAPQEAPATTLQ